MDPVFACDINQKFEIRENTMEQLNDDINNNSLVKQQDSRNCFDNMSDKELVVCLKNVRFSYTKKEKLINDLSVNIPGGQIYGLLGPSGCGKSTTLKIILGLIRPRKGLVRVFGKRPNSLHCPIPGPGAGYMPQELALMPTMTVADHFNYYGALNGMRVREVSKQSAYLMDLLQIPSMERQIENLSGGQQRRASLALSLLHSPPLLILDEPTVGIDPVLRNKIWEYLHQLACKEMKTIIITTHYIEEARNAHTIALMRYGRLLAEANPDRLLSQFKMSTIEDVFLNLCEKEDDTSTEVQNATETVKKEKQRSQKDKKTKSTTEKVSYVQYHGKWANNAIFDWLRVWAIMQDAFTFMNGKFLTILIACLLPTTQIFLFHFSIGKPVGILQISVSAPENRSTRFSDVFLERLATRDIQVEKYPTESQAMAAVTEGHSFASFEFKSNFTRCLINRMRKGFEASDYDIDCSQVRMAPDNTYQFIIFQLALHLRDAFIEAIYQFFPSLGYNPEALNIPVKVEEYVYGKEDFSYQEFMTPGMYMALVYLAPLIVTLFVLLEQKVYGHVERSRAAGARPLEILSAHFVANALILLFQTAIMMGVSLIYFEAQNHGSTLLLLGIVYMEGVAGIALAILMAAVLNNKLAALVFIYGLTISLWMICGVFWPIENITYNWARKIVHFFPLTMPVETARNIMNRGWFWHQSILVGFGATAVYTLIPLLLAFIVFK